MKKGFTIIELMIVLAIIGILLAIAIPSFIKVRQDSQKKAELAILNSGNQVVLEKGQVIPPPITDLNQLEQQKYGLTKMFDLEDGTVFYSFKFSKPSGAPAFIVFAQKSQANCMVVVE